MGKRKTGPRFTEREREYLIDQCAKMTLMGMTNVQIAERLAEAPRPKGRGHYDVDPSTVQRYIDRAREAWAGRAAHSVGKKIAAEDARIRLLIAEAFQAWEKSKLERRRVKTDRSQVRRDAPDNDFEDPTVVDMPVRKIEETVEKSCGDPRFLAEIGRNIDRLMKLHGMEIAPRQEDDEGLPNWLDSWLSDENRTEPELEAMTSFFRSIPDPISQ